MVKWYGSGCEVGTFQAGEVVVLRFVVVSYHC